MAQGGHRHSCSTVAGIDVDPNSAHDIVDE
jgi:hypothetical protein